MNQLNSIILEGNLVANAELSEPSKGFKVCKFSLGVNRFTKSLNGESIDEVSFFDVEAYGKLAESCEKNGVKGRGVRVVGRLKQSRWKNNDGKNQSRVYVIAEHIEYKPKFEKKDSPELKEADEDITTTELKEQEPEAVLEPVPVAEEAVF
ncbi:MAG: single-stranded DNA-binding protein [Treponema sp.]|nr:single-stranded DNA-binding protein [Treponema sp.]